MHLIRNRARDLAEEDETCILHLVRGVKRARVTLKQLKGKAKARAMQSDGKRWVGTATIWGGV